MPTGSTSEVTEMGGELPVGLRRPRTADMWREQRPQIDVLALEAPWVVGDWLADADRFGCHSDKTAHLNDDPRWDGTHAAKLQFVAEQYPPSTRLTGLGWDHHETVADIPPDVRDDLLWQAQADKWSLAELRRKATAARKALTADEQ